jgi:hypothetical protein
MAGTGNADKAQMLSSLKNNKELISFVNPDKLTEHEIDSVAIGYLAVIQLRTDSLILLTL